MLRRRKESDFFCPNVGRISFCVHFATCYDGDFDEFDVTINIKKSTPLFNAPYMILRLAIVQWQQVATGGNRWQQVATCGKKWRTVLVFVPARVLRN